MQLATLPMEVIVEMLVQASFSWRDLLNIRTTCKVLYEATKAREIWANLIAEYLSPTTKTPVRLILERPINHYNSQGLEDLILQFHRAQARLDWRQTKVTPMIYDKTFAPPDRRNFGKIRLLPGGRWLLGIMPMDRLCYFDLDAPEVKPVALTPPAYEVSRDKRHINRMCSWNIDQDKSFDVLTYNVSMVLGFSKGGGSEWRQEESRVDVWRIQLSVDQNNDDSGSASNWKTEKIATFPLDQRFINPMSVSIFRRQFAFTFDHQGDEFLAIVDWNQPNNGSLNYSRRYMEIDEDLKLDFSPISIQLLPNDYVFIAINHVISLISLKDSPTETGPPTPDTSFGKTIWQTETLDLSNYQVSAPFFCTGSTRFIITGRSMVYGLIIPNNRPKKRKIVSLAKLPFSVHVNTFLSTLGYNRTIANGRGPGDTQLFNFIWPEETTTADGPRNGPEASCVGFKLSNQPDDYPVPKFVTMDEQSGRMVARDPMQSSNIDVYSIA
ncbi:hypothetical protein D9619_009603 [Psilocybe cf. subviscida]|uniref:F-box domain-containing protein n=1 Tax=Psilocybe cf. subviscida TaxID=2480587 RepID=A0A8H5F688_9AGAR|nr:hypothetical protein D9619_009603 [Psilocybe cf. subviscida]